MILKNIVVVMMMSYAQGDTEELSCTFDGEMVQGAEFVKGQYTYRYM